MTVLVVGAGPTGLTAALELARRGVPVRIIEKRPDPSPFSRAVGITRASMDLLTPSGVAEALMAEAVVFSGITFHVGVRPVAALPLDFDADSRLWGLPQDRTEAHLAEALARHGVRPEYGTALTGLAQDEGGVEVTTTAGADRAEMVIGADGVHSAVREALGLEFPGHVLPETWSIADVESAGWADRRGFNGYLLPGGDICVVVPIGPARFRVIASQPDALAALPVPMEVERLNRAGTFHIHVRQVARYSHGRVHLAGDAAHCHSPVGGRGMNLGIADAADLAARIAGGDTSGYHAARHAAAAGVITATERVRRLLQGGRVGRGLAVTALRTAAALPPLRRAAVHRFVGN